MVSKSTSLTTEFVDSEKYSSSGTWLSDIDEDVKEKIIEDSRQDTRPDFIKAIMGDVDNKKRKRKKNSKDSKDLDFS